MRTLFNILLVFAVAIPIQLIASGSPSAHHPRPFSFKQKIESGETGFKSGAESVQANVYRANWRKVLYWNGAVMDTTSKNVYSYVNSTWVSEDLDQLFTGSSFADNLKTTYTYNNNADVLTEFREIWNGSAWENNLKFENQYDAQDNITRWIKLTWTGTAWDTTDGTKYINTYNGNNKLTSVTYQNYNAGAWVNSEKETYTLNGNNEWTEILVQSWNAGTSQWVNQYKVINLTWYSFSDFKILGATVQVWMSAVWINFIRFTATYNTAGNVLTELQESFSGTWQNDSRSLYTYDSNNNQTEVLDQDWNAGSWVLAYGTRNGYTYDAFNNILTDSVSGYDSGSSTWGPDMKYIYSWMDVTSVNEISSKNSGFSLYPNPAGGMVNIRLENISGNSDIILYDMLGNEVLKSVAGEGNSVISIDLKGYSSGIYLIRLQGSGLNDALKLILQ